MVSFTSQIPYFMFFVVFFPTAVDSEDGVAIETPGSINLETDFLLGNDLEFGDPDDENKIPDLDKYSGG